MGTVKYLILSVGILLGVAGLQSACLAQESGEVAADHPLAFINTSFPNASPLYWEFSDNGEVHIYLVYDQQRSSPNRANGHWHFQLQGRKGTELTLVLHNFDNVWNGRQGSPLNDRLISFVSVDGKAWKPIETELLEGNLLKIPVVMESDSMYVARLEPYRLSDLERFKRSISGHPAVEVTAIGSTVAGRTLEVFRIGSPAAPHCVLLRGRAHPWEPGGNWVIEGMIKRLLQDDRRAKEFLAEYCLYVLPIANMDGVARGMTRFNLLGADLNRHWDHPADARYAPENSAFESWLDKLAQGGQKIDLAIDFHNDNSGRLHVSRPDGDLEHYLGRMERLERLLRQHTWFTEGATKSSFRNPGSFGEGLLSRYGVVACVHELNANWIAGLDDYATAENWQLYGQQLCEVFYAYFGP